MVFFAQFTDLFSTTGCVLVHRLAVHFVFTFEHVGFCNLYLVLAIVHTLSSIFSNSGFVCIVLKDALLTLDFVGLHIRASLTMVKEARYSSGSLFQKCQFCTKFVSKNLFKLSGSLHFSCYLPLGCK